ncbi:DEAD-box ATP-dependent RNA helicase 31-like [Trifolium pratense]|uniref:DEAD-box ATP-dependent RNA helicase 31-like n=1 Tax=Trifolium pratense TaxID=57577 RepID=UPI001E6919EA|nr:DEAD-box ATP-dependent RNA helicase 31-like [Trifolium pratense]
MSPAAQTVAADNNGGFQSHKKNKNKKKNVDVPSSLGKRKGDDDFRKEKPNKKKSKKRSKLSSDNDDDDDNKVVAVENGGGAVSGGSGIIGGDSYLSDSRFDQCSVSPLSLKGIKDAGYEKMTIVQEATLPVILKGKDVLAKAKTGTGKTVAFLLPSIEAVVKSPPSDRNQMRKPILVLIICPTRELACQAAAEASKLLKYHPTIGAQVVIGGTNLSVEQKRIQKNPCQILVATPGRLRDHIDSTAGFPSRLMGVKTLVLDEADHLLDMGFRKDIDKIIAAVPKQRQTLMFSATIPDAVHQVCKIALKKDFEFINTVEEGTEETHAKVRQMHLIAPLDKHFSLLYVILKEHITDDVDYKVLVFCTTAMVTRLVADLLGRLNLNVREIHSRKPQSYRTRVSDEFRKSKRLILVTSDVSARGVDYPDVSLVIQVGLPADKQQYIHRLGRTGRKGKEGQGILLLAPWEEFFLDSAKDLPIEKAPVPSVDPETKKKVDRAISTVEMDNKERAYQAWLGYYNSNKKVGRDKRKLVELANEFSRSMGLDTPPAVASLVLGKMGLRNVPGLRSK